MRSADKWYGVTYKEDKETAVGAISAIGREENSGKISIQNKFLEMVLNFLKKTLTGKKTSPITAFLHDFWGLISKFNLKDNFVRSLFY